jgi:hypothetical protein
MYGGAATVLSPMELTDTSMTSASRMSSAQGMDFAAKHVTQHGGMAPVGDTGMLDSSLRAAARIGGLDTSYAAVAGMKDQAGGKRRKSRKASRKGRKASRKTRKSRKASRKNRKSRKMSGGMRELGYMAADAPGTLLTGSQARAALSNMNSEWQLAANPKSFAPNF